MCLNVQYYLPFSKKISHIREAMLSHTMYIYNCHSIQRIHICATHILLRCVESNYVKYIYIYIRWIEWQLYMERAIVWQHSTRCHCEPITALSLPSSKTLRRGFLTRFFDRIQSQQTCSINRFCYFFFALFLLTCIYNVLA